MKYATVRLISRHVTLMTTTITKIPSNLKIFKHKLWVPVVICLYVKINYEILIEPQQILSYNVQIILRTLLELSVKNSETIVHVRYQATFLSFLYACSLNCFKRNYLN